MCLARGLCLAHTPQNHSAQRRELQYIKEEEDSANKSDARE